MRRSSSPRPASAWDNATLTRRHLSVVPEVEDAPSDGEAVVARFIAGCGVEPRTHEERLREYKKALESGVSLARQFRDR